MANRLVYTCITILRLLPGTGLNVGKVIEQTSSDRSHVIEAIEYLKKAKMVTKEEDPTHKAAIICEANFFSSRIKESHERHTRI